MKRTSFTMPRHLISRFFLAAALTVTLFSSCSKEDEQPPLHSGGGNPNTPPVVYSSDVLDKWMTIQLRLIRNAIGIPNQAFSRHFGYAGVTALESLAPGFPAAANWSAKWNGLNGLPTPGNGMSYYLPANVNAAMAAINRYMFPNASAADKGAIDSLENALKQEFLTMQEPALVETSAQFGKAVAAAVYQWSETDGYKFAGAPYTPPAGPGLWVPLPNQTASTPYWGNNRPIVAGSTDNTQPAMPPAYSTDPASPFYLMVKQVYDASQNLTDDQRAMAIFWRDVPGITSPGHWISILQQAIRQDNASLSKAALAYALSGAAMNDALISCFKIKYQVNLVRPITYIRDVMGHTTWNTVIGTPPHPEFISAHAALSGASAEVMEKLFANVGTFTDHSYDYLGFAPRTYSSYRAVGEEAAKSRLYAGIHYQVSIDGGLSTARKVVANIFAKPSKGKMEE